jgi:hypothetical protein
VKTLTRLSILVFVLSLVVVSGAFAQQHKDMHKDMHMDKNADHSAMMNGKEVTLTGEILDMYCFMKHPDNGQGMEHAKCAQNCIKKGLPIGFKAADGTVYLITGKNHESAAAMVAEYAGMQSVLKGTVIVHDGVKSIEIASIAAAK